MFVDDHKNSNVSQLIIHEPIQEVDRFIWSSFDVVLINAQVLTRRSRTETLFAPSSSSIVWCWTWKLIIFNSRDDDDEREQSWKAIERISFPRLLIFIHELFIFSFSIPDTWSLISRVWFLNFKRLRRASERAKASSLFVVCINFGKHLKSRFRCCCCWCWAR